MIACKKLSSQGVKINMTLCFQPLQALMASTKQAAEICGEEKNCGTLEAGKYADVISVDGNPLDNIGLIADPGNAFVVIMKDGKIYKNAMAK